MSIKICYSTLHIAISAILSLSSLFDIDVGKFNKSANKVVVASVWEQFLALTHFLVLYISSFPSLNEIFTF